MSATRKKAKPKAAPRKAAQPAASPRRPSRTAAPPTVARVRLERPSLRREAEFLVLEKRSRRLHRPWVTTCDTPEAYRAWLKRTRRKNARSWFVIDVETNALAGVFNLSEIVSGIFLSAYMGYYAFAPSAGRGLMAAGLALVLAEAFGPLGLHRLEANVQPGNTDSIRLLKRAGFRKEGYSPRYLKIGGRWCDHERWARLADDPPPGRTR